MLIVLPLLDILEPELPSLIWRASITPLDLFDALYLINYHNTIRRGSPGGEGATEYSSSAHAASAVEEDVGD